MFTPPRLTLDPLLVTFWHQQYTGRDAGDAPAVSELIPPEWASTEAVSGPHPWARDGSYEGVIVRGKDGSTLFVERSRPWKGKVEVTAAAFPISHETGAELATWLMEHGLTCWTTDCPELPPADPLFDEDVDGALYSRSALYLHVYTGCDTLMQVLRHWAYCQRDTVLDDWTSEQDNAVLTATYLQGEALIMNDKSMRLLVMPALCAKVFYPGIRVYVAQEWSPSIVCRLVALEDDRVELLISTNSAKIRQRLVSYLEARFRVDQLPSPWGDIPAVDGSTGGQSPKPETDEISWITEHYAEAVRDELDRAILQQFIQGKTVREIAEELCRTEKTVRNRLTEMRKRVPKPDNERLYRRGADVSQHPRRQPA
ncbi:MAG: hypothetical protein IRY86_10165 [Thermorudis peleae]|nr:hypothetical protein [Thermorudis peleae]